MQLSAQHCRFGISFVMIYVVTMPLWALGRQLPLIVIDADESGNEVEEVELCDVDKAYGSG